MAWLKKLTRSTFTTGLILTQSALGFGADLKSVPHVDLSRYMGDWNVIALIPNFLEKDCVSSIESYALRSDGKIDNWFVCHKKDGSELKLTSLAWVHNTETNAEWRVQFNWDTFLGRIPIPLAFSYVILDLDAEAYTYTVVGHPNRKLLWIMAREKSIEAKKYEEILSKVAQQGFDPKQIITLPQH
jgi:apolipoprotein D and lipocalin family protein